MAPPVIVCCGQACEAPRTLDLRGLLSFWILWELRLGRLLGAQLAERLAWRRGTAPSPGTLYPALAALAKAGLVRKERSGRDTAYELSAAGRRELDCAKVVLAALLQDVVAEARAGNAVLTGPGPEQRPGGKGRPRRG